MSIRLFIAIRSRRVLFGFNALRLDLTNRKWFSVVHSLIDNDTRHHSGQNVVDSRGAAHLVLVLVRTTMYVAVTCAITLDLCYYVGSVTSIPFFLLLRFNLDRFLFKSSHYFQRIPQCRT